MAESKSLAPHGLFIVGRRGGTHVGDSFYRAAQGMGLDVTFFDVTAAQSRNPLLNRLYWHMGGKRLAGMRRFGKEIIAAASLRRPSVLIGTGAVPLTSGVVSKLRQLGVLTLNYSTDDPWNPAHRAAWYLDALRQYDHVFTTRRANQSDLERHCGNYATYLPFAYDPEVLIPPPMDGDLRSKLHAEILFVGGADADRIPIIQSLIQAGFKVAVYGGYWNRDAEIRACDRGLVSPVVIASATLAADVNLCLVRRANRDGHVMRSFELAALGACMLVEDTAEHRELFGADGACVRYFNSRESMVACARDLLARPEERIRLSSNVRQRIHSGGHTYRDRLQTMLEVAATLNGKQ